MEALQRQPFLWFTSKYVDSRIVSAVEVLRPRDSSLLRRLAKGLEHGPLQTLPLHTPFTAAAVVLARAAIVVLGLLEHRQHRLPGPARILRQACPFVVVLPLATHVDHSIDRRGAAEDPPARVQERAPVEAGLRDSLIEPVGTWVADAVEVADRNVNPVIAVDAARLEQQHVHFGVGREPIGQQAASGSGSHDDVVVLVRVQRAHHGITLGDPGAMIRRPAATHAQREHRARPA